MLAHPENGYNFLYATYLPIFLLGGMAFGIFEGALIWAIGHVTERRLHWVLRVVLATAILTLLLALYAYIYLPPVTRDLPKLKTYFSEFGGYIPYGAVFGLMIGSRIRPLYELVRGATPPRWPVMSCMTGLLLRVFVIFSLMEAVLFYLWTLQRDFRPREYGFGVAGLVHFILATVLLFVRLPFWLLLPLAVVINFPVATLITDVLADDEIVIGTITLNYLALWAAFLTCRVSVPRAFTRNRLLATKKP